jgi:hypothetical protein
LSKIFESMYFLIYNPICHPNTVSRNVIALLTLTLKEDV